MAAYYNEIDPFAVAWLRELITEGLIADGEVDDRSIELVRPDDLRGFTQCHFFAGIGGWSYALRLAGWPDDREVWTGSCPCQPFSNAGKGHAFDDSRHLWPTWFRLIGERRPAIVFGEQVGSAAGRGWLDTVSTDLEALDYAFGAADLPASSVGTPHIRYRLWFVAHTNAGRCSGAPARQSASDRERDMETSKSSRHANTGEVGPGMQSPWPPGPGAVQQIPRMADGISDRVAERNAYGNAIVPPLAAAFIEAYLATQREP